MHFANLSLSESEIVSGFDLYAEKEGKLKDFFESFLEDNYSWEEIASQISCSYSVAYDWVSKLENATKKGLLLWEVVDRKQYVLYSTTYEKTEVKMYIVYEMIQERWDFGRHFRNHGDHILIYENERRIFHYGNIDYHDYDTSDDNNPEIIQEPMIRRLGVTIGKWNANWKRKLS